MSVQSSTGTQGLRVLAMVSGKGGVGKTNITVNLALALARRNRRVLVVDADLGLANVDIVLGLHTRYTLYDAISGKVSLPEILVEGPGGIWVLPAASGVYEMTCLTDEQRYLMLQQIELLEDRFDTVIIDNSAGISRDVQFFAGAAREVMVITDREPTSITDAYATIKILSQRRTNSDFMLLVNSARSEQEALDVYRRLTQVTDRFLAVSISYFGSVPRDENVNRAVMARRPLLELFPDSPAAEKIDALAEKFLKLTPPDSADGGMKMFWERLFRQSSSSQEVR